MGEIFPGNFKWVFPYIEKKVAFWENFYPEIFSGSRSERGTEPPLADPQEPPRGEGGYRRGEGGIPMGRPPSHKLNPYL